MRSGVSQAAAMGGVWPLAGGLPEPWAVEWGEDEFGLFQSFGVGEVVHRLRWVPPGRFRMGSPEGEAGRWEDEGPQHDVVLTQGFWLGETPCSQALWEAVMGDNPSYFLSPDRPVEQVSWEECANFLAELDRRVSGLGVRLPTEAEWEYACRAGTTTATWAGDLVLHGANHAPVLDAIAWYGGNSGRDFDLDKGGYDSSNWPDKQYPHTRAGTRRVGEKQPNPWGFHDMLGNVFEWCSDWNGPYSDDLFVDPTGPAAGTNRVIRGGSWFYQARVVRAACRGAGLPGYRGFDLGFRVARGQVPRTRSGASRSESSRPSRGSRDVHG